MICVDESQKKVILVPLRSVQIPEILCVCPCFSVFFYHFITRKVSLNLKELGCSAKKKTKRKNNNPYLTLYYMITHFQPHRISAVSLLCE